MSEKDATTFESALCDAHTNVMCITEWSGDLSEKTALALLKLRTYLRQLDDYALPPDQADMKMESIRSVLVGIEEDITHIAPLIERDGEKCRSLLHQLIETIRSLPPTQKTETHSLSDPAVRQQVLAMTGGHCAYCDVQLVNGGGDGDQFCVEHVVPASKGGPNHVVNYVPSCRSCNNSKSNLHVLEFIRFNLRRAPQHPQPPTATVIPINAVSQPSSP